MQFLAFFPTIAILHGRGDQNCKSSNLYIRVHQIVYFSILWGCPLQNKHFWGNWCQRHREYKCKNCNFAWEVLRKSLPCTLKEKSKNVNFEDPCQRNTTSQQVSEASWALSWTPKLGPEGVQRPQSDFIFLLTDFEQKICLLEKAKIVILRGRGVQNQHLQFACVWYNDFSENVIFNECIIVFERFLGVLPVRTTHFWVILEAPKESKSIKIRA